MLAGVASPSQPLVTRVQRAVEAKDSIEIHAEDVVLDAPGWSPLGGTTRGRAAVLAALGTLHELSGGTFGPAATVMTGQGPFVTVVHHVTATRGGRRLSQCIAEIWRFEGEGDAARCVEVRVQFEDLAAWDAFWR